MFKKGRYTSYANHLSRAKSEHEKTFKRHGVLWTADLDLEFKDSIRSVERGMGPSRQSYPIDLRQINLILDVFLPVRDDGPGAPIDAVTFGGCFMMREIELSLLLFRHVTLDEVSRCVSVYLPASKNDREGNGVSRQLSCICVDGAHVLCPYHAALRLRDHVVSKYPGGVVPHRTPFVLSAVGGVCEKDAIVSTIEALAKRINAPILDPAGNSIYGGAQHENRWRTVVMRAT